jgi:hypothetical protein
METPNNVAPPSEQSIAEAVAPAVAEVSAAQPADARTPAAPPGTQITLGQLVDAFEILQEFASRPFDGVTAAKIVRLSRWATPHYGRYVDARAPVAEQFGERIAPNRYRISPARLGEFTQAMAPIRAEVIAIDPAVRLDVRSLVAVQITPVALETLEPFLAGV